MDVPKMLRSISYKKFLDWQLFAELEPFDSRRSDYQAATIVATLLNQWRGKGKRPITANYVLKHLLPFGDNADIDDSVPKQTAKEMKNMAQFLCKAFNSLEKSEERKKAQKESRAAIVAKKQADRAARAQEKQARQEEAERQAALRKKQRRG